MKDRYHLPNPAYEGGFLGGDIAGIRQQMAYLKSLGETSVLVYPMLLNDEDPFFQYLATGYRVKDYQRVDPNFGTEQDLAGMIADFHSTANGRRVGVIMDLPIGMTGVEHPWVADAADYPWYFRPWNPIASENIAAAPAHLPYGDVDNAFGMDIINHTQGMDTGTSTYAALRDDIVFWLTDHFDIDGFRYDSAQNAYPAFWRQLLLDFRARYGASKPHFMQVAEAFVVPPKKTWQVWVDEFMDARVNNDVGPIQMDGAYDFGVIDEIQDVFARGADVGGIVDSMDFSGLVFEHPERLLASVDNYEDPTFLSTVTGGHGRQKLFLAEAFLLTADRVPLVFSGNEYGIDYSEPGALFQPGLDPTFLARFKQLTMIRRTRPAFHRGARRWLERTPTILSYLRSYQGTNFVVVLNDANTSQSITVKLGSRGIPCSSVRNLLKPNDAAIHLDDPGTPTATLSVDLTPYEPKIVACAT
jgi:alpha-amylase